MEMPVPCISCGEWVELNDTRQSPYRDDLVCRSCFDKLSERKELEDEIFELELDFENDAEYLQGQKREYRKQLKELKEKLQKLS